MFLNITQIVKKKLFFNDSKRRKMALSCSKKLLELLGGITSKKKKKEKGGFYCLNCLHSFRNKLFQTNLNRIKKYVKIKIFVV